MLPYSLLRRWLFAIDAERAHELVLGALQRLSDRPVLLAALGALYGPRRGGPAVEAMGIRFPNPVGLAAGLDKDARCAPAFAAMGFGFVELGTVTPLPQPGNPRPRMFRLVEDAALVNRMGFNSAGLARFLDNLKSRAPRVPVGVNLGKNAATPLERAADDYRRGMEAVYRHADYVAVNVSSPNTGGLRRLQEAVELKRLLRALSAHRARLEDEHAARTPVAIKIAPDLSDDALERIAASCVEHGVDAIVATNTTTARPGELASRNRREPGGLSGRPLAERSLDTVHRLSRALDGALPIIGVGGIMSAPDAIDRLQAGATLIQLYTGLIYRGPALLRAILAELDDSSCPTRYEPDYGVDNPASDGDT